MSSPKDSSSRSRPRFEPQDVERRGTAASQLGDERSGALYVYSPRLKLAVNVALATGRPLLVRGAPGWGKSSLASAVARYFGWRYLEKVISSRTQARDLMLEVDLLRRLSDAQARGRLDLDWRRYIRPGLLWKAFDPAGADRQDHYFLHGTEGPERNGSQVDTKPAVVLLDEMDKAEPDVPNNLLVALGSLQFTVDEIGTTPVKAQPALAPLIIVTTNDERDLPRAFLRRCVELELPAVDDTDGSGRKELLVQIGVEHLAGRLDETFVREVADLVRSTENDQVVRRRPAPAESGRIHRCASSGLGDLWRGSNAQACGRDRRHDIAQTGACRKALDLMLLPITMADLLRAFDRLRPQDDDEKRAVANLLGFEWQSQSTAPDRMETVTAQITAAADVPVQLSWPQSSGVETAVQGRDSSAKPSRKGRTVGFLLSGPRPSSARFACHDAGCSGFGRSPHARDGQAGASLSASLDQGDLG